MHIRIFIFLFLATVTVKFVFATTVTPTTTDSGQVTTTEVRRNRFWREWRRSDPSVNKNMWNTKSPLGKAELYIYLALAIGFATVVVGCWLSDNCWSPEPEHMIMMA